jgi:hypothetical protein
MNPVHVHLMLNHIPVLGMIFATLLLGHALWHEKAELRKLALGLFVLLAVITPIVYLSGHGAEESVERLAGVSEAALERHEDAGRPALIAMFVSGAGGLFVSLAWVWPAAAGIRRKAAWGLFALGLASSGWLAWTALTGGQIRHAEELETTLPTGGGHQDADD